MDQIQIAIIQTVGLFVVQLMLLGAGAMLLLNDSRPDAKKKRVSDFQVATTVALIGAALLPPLFHLIGV